MHPQVGDETRLPPSPGQMQLPSVPKPADVRQAGLALLRGPTAPQLCSFLWPVSTSSRPRGTCQQAPSDDTPPARLLLRRLGKSTRVAVRLSERRAGEDSAGAGHPPLAVSQAVTAMTAATPHTQGHGPLQNTWGVCSSTPHLTSERAARPTWPTGGLGPGSQGTLKNLKTSVIPTKFRTLESSPQKCCAKQKT